MPSSHIAVSGVISRPAALRICVLHQPHLITNHVTKCSLVLPRHRVLANDEFIRFSDLEIDRLRSVSLSCSFPSRRPLPRVSGTHYHVTSRHVCAVTSASFLHSSQDCSFQPFICWVNFTIFTLVTYLLNTFTLWRYVNN